MRKHKKSRYTVTKILTEDGVTIRNHVENFKMAGDREYCKASYMPTLDEIREACLKIQKGWSANVRAGRLSAVTNDWLTDPIPTNFCARQKAHRTSADY